jgi:hypothetical protein
MADPRDFPAELARLPWHIDDKDKDPRSETDRCQSALKQARIICPAVDIVAIPNAARRTRWEVTQRRREGMKAGALDWVVTWNRGVAFVEWKNGREMPDENQADRLDMYMRWGFHCGVFRREDSFFAWLRASGAPFIDRPREQGARPIGEILEPIVSDLLGRLEIAP